MWENGEVEEIREGVILQAERMSSKVTL